MLSEVRVITCKTLSPVRVPNTTWAACRYISCRSASQSIANVVTASLHLSTLLRCYMVSMKATANPTMTCQLHPAVTWHGSQRLDASPWHQHFMLVPATLWAWTSVQQPMPSLHFVCHRILRRVRSIVFCGWHWWQTTRRSMFLHLTASV